MFSNGICVLKGMNYIFLLLGIYNSYISMFSVHGFLALFHGCD
jgi:hypothetical protein